MAKQVQTLGKITKRCAFGQQPHKARRKESAHMIIASSIQAGSWGIQADGLENWASETFQDPLLTGIRCDPSSTTFQFMEATLNHLSKVIVKKI